MKTSDLNFGILPDKKIKIPVWRAYEFIFSGGFSIVFMLHGIIHISDGAFGTHFYKSDKDMVDVLFGILLVVPALFHVYRIINYPGIIFTKDHVMIPPVIFYHWKVKTLYYHKIKEISFGTYKEPYRVSCKENIRIKFPKHDFKNKLWIEFDKELCKRHIQSFMDMGNKNKAKNLYETYQEILSAG